ncbi:MAG: Putative phosphinothricin acetyltransferase YwnH [Nitrospira sp.]|nr:MAG: Putative phosphinothricin acetyltransferase YwnH [Nitrospira sp.]
MQIGSLEPQASLMDHVLQSAHRVAKRDDLRQIVEIYNATIPSRLVTADTEPVSVESRLPWFNDHTAQCRPLWVLEVNGHIGAWLSFSSFYGRPAYSKTAEISVYVHEAHRGQGLASYLLVEALKAASSLKLDTLLGFIFGHNAPSLGLFAKFGFERWGLLPKVATLDGIERDLVIVGRRAYETPDP